MKPDEEKRHLLPPLLFFVSTWQQQTLYQGISHIKNEEGEKTFLSEAEKPILERLCNRVAVVFSCLCILTHRIY